MGAPKGNKYAVGNDGGRPTTFTQELADKICNRIALGESTRSILRDENMPSSGIFYKWLLDENKKEFLEQYEKACNIRAELMFEELNEIADDGSNDFIEKKLESGEVVEQLRPEHIQRSRLRVDTRKWYLSKVLPKKFGDKVDVTSGGKPIPILGGITNVSSNNSNQEDNSSEQEN